MTTRYTKYCSYLKLPCANAAVRDVVLCLQDAALIVQPNPECGFPITTIDASICQAYTLSDGCQNQLWYYTFSYDDTQLTNPTTPLVPGDITGVFCKDCLTDWVQEQISCVQFLGSLFIDGKEYVWPTSVGTAGQSLKIGSVVGDVITLVWG